MEGGGAPYSTSRTRYRFRHARCHTQVMAHNFIREKERCNKTRKICKNISPPHLRFLPDISTYVDAQAQGRDTRNGYGSSTELGTKEPLSSPARARPRTEDRTAPLLSLSHSLRSPRREHAKRALCTKLSSLALAAVGKLGMCLSDTVNMG